MRFYIVCKRVGAAAIAVLAVAALTVGLTGAAQATDGELHFTLVAVDSAPAANGVKHMLVLSGYGSFTANSVEGGGTYAHFDGASDVPKTMLGSGAWQANKVLRWTAADGGVTVGRVNPGVLDLRIDLIPDQGPVIKGGDASDQLQRRFRRHHEQGPGHRRAIGGRLLAHYSGLGVRWQCRPDWSVLAVGSNPRCHRDRALEEQLGI